MRKIAMRVALAALVIVAAFGLSSCSLLFGFIFPSEFEVNGITYDIDDVYVYEWGATSFGSYDLDLVLISGGITVQSDGTMQGTGTVVYLDLASPSSSFETGDYDWNTERYPYSIVDGYVRTNATYDGQGGITYQNLYTVTGGSVFMRVPISLMDEIVFDIELATDTGGSLEGHFRGQYTDQLYQPTYFPSVK